MSLRVRLHVCSHGNLFMTEIALLLRSALDDLGAEVQVVRDELPTAESGWCNLVVAHHEFFPLVGATDEQRLEAASHSVVVTTEQPHTQWYENGRAYARVARAVLDINALAVETLNEEGVRAHRLRLGYHESWDHWRGVTRPRPLDVLFMGSLSPTREARLARLGPVMASHATRVIVHDGSRPVTGAAENFVWGDDKFELLAGTKVLLNLHRARTPYMEWHRVLAALTNGCAVLSDGSESYDPLVPYEHFFTTSAATFGDALQMVLAADELREQVATAAYDFVRTQYRMTDLLMPFLDVFASAATPHAAHRLRQRAIGRELHTLPEIPDPRERQPAHIAPNDRVSRAVRRALLNQTGISRRIDRLVSRLEHGSEQRVEMYESASYADAQPDVSVIVPVYNYEAYVGDALESIARSIGVRPDIVVVDDHSTDASRATVEAFIDAHPEVPIRLIGLSANQGLSVVRNLALDHVRAEYVFFVDADNEVYPRTLAKLRDALSGTDAAFAYGMIECFGEEEKLLSVYPWDVDRLLYGNYIDAMVLMRTSVLRAQGGFSVDMQNLHGGWEDYEMWLRLAANGERGVLVPEIVARYRVHGSSMVATVNLDSSGTYHYLRGQYPQFPWPEIAEPDDTTSKRMPRSARVRVSE